MLIETRFGLGDSVVAIDPHTARMHRKCEVCKGTGWVRFPGASKDSVCPEEDCRWGSVYFEDDVTTFNITFGTVGKVAYEAQHENRPDSGQMFDNVVDPEDDPITVTKVTYMLHQTGVGSGRVYLDEKVFATLDEALALALREGWVRNTEVVPT